MDIVIIITLVLLGVLLLLAEVFVLPGLTLAAIGSGASFIAALYFSYNFYGFFGFIVTLITSIIFGVVMVIISMKKNTLKRLSLENKIDSKVSFDADKLVKIGDKGYTKTRMSPMGSVVVQDNIFEAKSFDGFLDPNTEVEVTGFEGSVIIVKQLNNI